MSMNRDNFRANQPPSKVLHIRNLPPDATEADIVELCRPYGRIVKTKLNTGSAKQQGNQAFVEFENVNVAMKMIYSFVGSADPPKVRNKTVYLQYSTRSEIGSGNWGHGGGGGGSSEHQQSGNVILIIMDNIQVALGPTLDTVHMLCAAFGEVAKIAMFEKASGLQALVQFKDSRPAREAQQTLDGSPIPEHLVPQHPGKITMKVSFSAHSDLSIRSQGDRSRDFTVPYHADGAAAAGMGMDYGSHYAPIGSSNVLLVMIDDVAYSPNVEALHTIFSTYGHVLKMTIFEKSGNWQALVQYPDDATAAMAKQTLDGYTMYAGGKNRLKMEFSTHRDLQVWGNNERNWDFILAPGGPVAAKEAAAAHAAAREAAARDAAAREAAAKDAAARQAARQEVAAEAAAAAAAAGGGGSSQAGAGGAAADAAAETQGAAAAAAAAAGGIKQPDGSYITTGSDWEHAHNEAARLATEALGDSLAGLPAHGSGPRTMLPHARGPRGPPAAASAAAAGYPAGPPPGPPGYGYGPPPGADPYGGYGAPYGPPGGYGYGYGY
uniref:RRM domain-containing protein n=1 Tax=Tetradesmus obliquus TaxID=3088 RepID=A0A383W6L8_TETOB|eukprot:jgi/Sobl393_1/15690/SZX73101.1